MKLFSTLAATTAILAPVWPAWAASDTATRFGAREAVGQMSLSPDGKHVAFLQPTQGGRGTAVMIADMEDGSMKPILVSSGDPDRLRYCQWSTDTRLVCGIFMIAPGPTLNLGYTRLIATDLDGKNVQQLSARTSSRALGTMQGGGNVIDLLADDKPGSVLMTRAYIPESTVGTILASSREGLGVDRVDTGTLKRSNVEPPKSSAIDYMTDGHGTVRVMAQQSSNDSGYVGNRVNYFYRKPGERAWQPLSTATVDSQTQVGFDPQAIDRDKNLVYGIDNEGGRAALFSIALDGSLRREKVFGRDDVDVDGVIRIGRQRRTVGVTFATDRRQTVFFDPQLKALGAALSKAMPGLPLVEFVDASADESKLLLWAGSDVDPGRYYFYDKATHKLAEILPVRSALAATKLAPVTPITFKAADGTAIPGYLTLPPGSDGKNLPAIVMPHGGPTGRDEWRFDWLSQFFAARGYAVLQPNFRGSSGYGSDWFQKNGFQSWRTAIGDVNDAGRWLIAQGIAQPSKIAIFGASYGGYAALQSAVLDPKLFKAIVAWAPVTDLTMLREEHRNWADFHLVEAFVGSGEHLQSGSPAQNAARITAPVLMFHGTLDQNVAIAESRTMASRLKGAGKSVELVEFPGLDHYLEDSRARAEMLDKADTFLRTTLGL